MLNERGGFGLGRTVGSNERLEFLGDSVLGFVVADYLYRTRPELDEGQLTDLRTALVRARTLAAVAQKYKLGDLLYLGKGEAASGGRVRATMLAQAYEAVVGAIFVDQGIEAAREFILRGILPELDEIDRAGDELTRDDKSKLQEIAQAEVGITPSYEIVGARGPEHAREFEAEVRLGELGLARGHGPSKQEAEQASARAALDAWSEFRRQGYPGTR